MVTSVASQWPSIYGDQGMCTQVKPIVCIPDLKMKGYDRSSS